VKTDFRDRSHLKVHDGDRPEDKPRTWRRRGLDEDEQLTCWQCLADTGVETSMTMEVTLAPRRKPDGRKTGGTKAHVCVYCLSRGKVTKGKVTKLL
jgi:hypothetical protein